MPRLARKAVQPIIQLALREDAASRDATSRAVIPANARIRARIVAKASGIVAGVPVAVWTLQTVDPALRCVLKRRDGQVVRRGQTILTIEGRARSIFAAERTALNLLGHLSGIATLTAAYATRVRGMRAKIFDTRKTLPGLRTLEKYAVRAGGGQNHRSDLASAILIKTNQVRVTRRPIWDLVRRARRIKGKSIEIEVANLAEFRAALQAGPDAILLDNWPPAAIRKAVSLRKGRTPLLEASGGVTLANVRAIAKTRVDRISIGRLTHSAPALDVSLNVI